MCLVVFSQQCFYLCCQGWMVSVCDAFAFRVHISLQSSAPGDDTRVSRLLGQYQ